MYAFRLTMGLLLGLVLLGMRPATAHPVWTVETLPDPKSRGTGYVADPDSILATAERDAINQRIARIERQSGVQLAIVIVHSIGSEVPKTFASQLYNRWGVGPRDSRGLLILTVLDQRRTETETGYGLEGALPDSRLARLQEAHLVPRFRAGEFGAGLLDYLTALEPFVYDAEAATEAEREYALRDSWHLFLGGILLLLLLTLLVNPSAKQLKPPSDGSPHYPPAIPARSIFDWTLRLWGPVLLAVNWLAGGFFFSPFAVWPFLAVCWFNLGLLLLYIRIRNNKLALASWTDPYHRYQHLKKVNSLLGLEVLLFLPIMLPVWLAYRRRLQLLRYEPRVSQQTGRPLRRLSEAEEDAWLTPGKQMEEELRTVDHDVWLDDETGEVLVLPYKQFQLTYSPCPRCTYITYRQTSSEVLVSPTYTSEGRGAKYHQCKHCGHRHTTYYNIPKKVRTESGSSVGSSGGSARGSSGGSSWSGSSSWGGGSSGGGGAGSSW